MTEQTILEQAGIGRRRPSDGGRVGSPGMEPGQGRRNPDNGMDLLDYVLLLWEYRRHIAAITATFAVLLLAAAFILPKKYGVKAIMDIGGGHTTQEVKLKIEEVYFPASLVALGMAPGSLPAPRISVPRGLNVVHLGIEHADSVTAVKVLRSIVDSVVSEHKRDVDYAKAKMESSIRKMELNLQRQDEGFDRIERERQAFRASHELDLRLKRMDIESMKERAVLVSKEISFLNQDKDILSKHLSTADGQIRELEAQKRKLNSRASADNALSALFFTNEIQTNQKYYLEMEKDLSTNFHRSELNLNAAVEENKRSLEKADLAYEQTVFNGKMKEKDFALAVEELEKGIEVSKIDLDLMRWDLENIRGTIALVPPTASASPVWPSKKKFLLTGILLGVFVGLIFALFMQRYKEVYSHPR